MPATVTDSLKRKFLEVIFNEVTNNLERYYVGVGRSDPWDDAGDNPTTPVNSVYEERNFRLGWQSVKRIVDVSYVVPRKNWTSGTTYSRYDDNYSSYPTNPYYVITDDNQVYICLKQSTNDAGVANPSTVKPTTTDTVKPQKTSDGYIWKFLYTIGGATANKFLSANFMPVEYVNDSPGGQGLTGLQVQQAEVRAGAIPKQVLGWVVDSGGRDFTAAPTITIVGNGDSVGIDPNTPIAAASATLNGSIISKVEVDSSADSTASFGRNYDYASVTLAGGGGTGAVIRPIIGPDSGIGANPIHDLRATSIMFNVKPDGGEPGADLVNDWVVNEQDYRQVALVYTPNKGFQNEYGNVDSNYTADTGRVSPYLVMASPANASQFTLDQTITDGTATGLIVDIDNDRIYYQQNITTGFERFDKSRQLTADGLGNFDIDSVVRKGDIDPFSGEIMYLENRAAVERIAGQVEDIKIIITL